MGNPFRRAILRYRLPHSFFVARKRVKYGVLTLFRAKFVIGATVRKPKYWKYRRHDGDTSRYLEIQFPYHSVRKCLRHPLCLLQQRFPSTMLSWQCHYYASRWMKHLTTLSRSSCPESVNLIEVFIVSPSRNDRTHWLDILETVRIGIGKREGEGDIKKERQWARERKKEQKGDRDRARDNKKKDKEREREREREE